MEILGVINKPYPEPELQSSVKERMPYFKRKQNPTTPECSENTARLPCHPVRQKWISAGYQS